MHDSVRNEAADRDSPACCKCERGNQTGHACTDGALEGQGHLTAGHDGAERAGDGGTSHAWRRDRADRDACGHRVGEHHTGGVGKFDEDGYLYIVDRKKVGFKVPLDEWFRGPLRDYTHDLLLGPDSFVSGYFDRGVIAAMLADHLACRRNEEQRLWTLMGLEFWHRVFFRNSHQPGAQ